MFRAWSLGARYRARTVTIVTDPSTGQDRALMPDPSTPESWRAWMLAEKLREPDHGIY